MNYYADGGMTTQELPASQIIMSDTQSQKAGAESVVMAVNQLVQEGKAVLVRHNNSIMVLISIGDGEAETHLFTLDPPHRLAAALKHFHDELVKSGINKVYATEMPDKQLIKMMLAVGIPVEKSDKPDYYVMGIVT
jgi:hypothetical protein